MLGTLSRKLPASYTLATGAGAPAFLQFSRGFRKVSKDKTSASKQKPKSGGRDPYATFKAAIIAEPNETLIAELSHETEEERLVRLKENSRLASREHKRQMGHLSRLVKLRNKAIAALPQELREAAQQPDLTLFPIQRRVFTETAPIPDFQVKLASRDTF